MLISFTEFLYARHGGFSLSSVFFQIFGTLRFTENCTFFHLKVSFPMNCSSFSLFSIRAFTKRSKQKHVCIIFPLKTPTS